MRRSTLIAALLLTTAGLPAIAAQTGGGGGGGEAPPEDAHPACLPGDVVDNDELRIHFHGAKFQLQVVKKNESGDGIDGKYQYKSTDVVELGEDNETLAELKLENAEPQDSECSVEESGNWTNVTYTATEPVRTPGEDDGPSVGTATVELVYHFNRSDDSAKFDLNVQDWPWQGEDSELAYDFEVTSDWVIEPAENGLGFRDGDDGEAEAFIEWAPNATAHYDDGHEERSIVDSNTTGGDHHVDTRLRFTNVTAGYEELDYDPEVAVGPYLIVADLLVPLNEVPAPLRAPLAGLV